MSSTDCSSTWSTFILDLSDSITDENTFFRRFQALCARIRQRDPQRLLAKFLRHHDHIGTFVSTLDESTGLWGTHSLSSIFWSKAYDAVEKALVTRQYDRLTREYLPHLKTVMPAFGAKLPLFPASNVVQKPLQDIFSTYMGCYELMLQHLGSRADTDSLNLFSSHTVTATRSIALLRTQWEERVQEEIENPKAKGTPHMDRLDITAYSNYNTSVGPYDPGIINASFERLELLGRGTFGEVHKVRETSTGALYARKITRITDPRFKSQLERNFRSEITIMQSFRHHHIASVQFPIFDGDSYSFIMLPVAECDLRGFMRSFTEDDFPRTELKHLTTWFGCLVGALSYAHSRDVKHEDIKPSNILIRDHLPYLTDFGCAKDFSDSDNSTPIDSATTGTPAYWPPENLPRGRKADVFSLGCVFSEMLTVRHQHTITDFQNYRYVQHRDNGYAFRENLAKVEMWLNEIVSEKDPMGMLLKEQTMLMLEPEVGKRVKARDVKRALRIEGDLLFCHSCNNN